jgi:hypothetical protein
VSICVPQIDVFTTDPKGIPETQAPSKNLSVKSPLIGKDQNEPLIVE